MHNKPRAFFGIYDEAKGVEESTTEGKREGEMNRTRTAHLGIIVVTATAKDMVVVGRHDVAPMAIDHFNLCVLMSAPAMHCRCFR
jgi:hypothetical protein